MRLVAVLLLLLTAACAQPSQQGLGPARHAPAFDDASFTMADGAVLPYRLWQPAGEIKAVILALHGFNDYSRAWEMPAETWAKAGIATYAYDQRGFGQTGRDGGNWGQWPGADALVADARLALATLKHQHPGVPLYLLGHSMGAAVALSALADQEPLADGLILVAPATWGGENMNPFYRAGLWLGAHLAPSLTLTGRGLGRVASDNRAFLIENGRDPLFIKETRIDAVYGLTGLMGQAAAAGHPGTGRTLILTGAKDEIIPPAAQIATARRLTGSCQFRWLPEGWHMLLADQAREGAFAQIQDFVTGNSAGPPLIPCRDAAAPY